MFRSVFGRLLTESRCVLRGVQRRPTPRGVSLRGLSGLKDGEQFDLSLLELLVCPLSKKPLRWTVEQAAHVLGLGSPAEEPDLYPAFDHLPVSPPSTQSPQ